MAKLNSKKMEKYTLKSPKSLVGLAPDQTIFSFQERSIEPHPPNHKKSVRAELAELCCKT